MEGNIVNYITQIRGVSYKPSDLHDSLNKNSIILLRANNINNGKINFEDVVYVDKSKVSETQVLRKNDILICASSGSKKLVRKAASFNESIECTFGAFCKVIRPRNILGSYLSAFFQSEYYKFHISQLANGANINNIKNEHINSFSIPERSFEEQKEISYKVSSLNRIIESYNRELELLDELIKARFVEMFGDNKYEELAVEKVCTSIVDCPHTTPKYNGDLRNPAIRTSEIKKGFITWDTMKYVSDEEYIERTARLKPQQGDIVYGREGTFGNAAILPKGYKFCLGQRVMLLRPNNEFCISQYLLRALISDEVYNQALAKNNASTVAHVNVKDVKNFMIPVPPLELQNQFASFVEEIDKSRLRELLAIKQIKLLLHDSWFLFY